MCGEDTMQEVPYATDVVGCARARSLSLGRNVCQSTNTTMKAAITVTAGASAHGGYTAEFRIDFDIP